MNGKTIIRLEEKRQQRRARLPDKELEFYEELKALSLHIIDALKPVVLRVPADDMDLVLDAMQAALLIRQSVIIEEYNRKREVVEDKNDH